MAKQELLASVRDRYQQASKRDKRRILDELIAITGHHRKQAIRRLQHAPQESGRTTPLIGWRIYDEVVRESVISVCEVADLIWGKG